MSDSNLRHFASSQSTPNSRSQVHPLSPSYGFLSRSADTSFFARTEPSQLNRGTETEIFPNNGRLASADIQHMATAAKADMAEIRRPIHRYETRLASARVE